MATVYEVTIDGGSRVETVKGDHMYVEREHLIIEDGKGVSVAIFATFNSVIAKPVEQE
ncbi:hypothetical protein [Pseudomonas extremaustralis]|uniref:Uncharacterized protein n=1 Tax=Pseudomonas extremaustralis TaxID=359110 RepID=A0ABY0N100_9PSED|nr:hypothetical protein [Pseudomonas extremaustralis]SDE70144.1 hypothetical protein SAMN05216591_0667 [Pseudomonas extremaustralis]